MDKKKPTVGRTVMYKPYGAPHGDTTPDLKAAIVTKVIQDNMVNLVVFHDNGFEFILGANIGDREGQWNWPVIV